jgi:hypothetical protein
LFRGWGLSIGLAQPRQLVDHLIERLAMNELHCVKSGLVVEADLENRHDIGVMQAGRRLGLAAESLEGAPFEVGTYAAAGVQ